ncbi:MAG: hypothetical protein IKQ95_08800 [Synergistaceae bacterium]|nr:hypothetical protein [Synergistaceae bacterium]
MYARITEGISSSGQQQSGQAEFFTGYISEKHAGHIIIGTVTFRAGRIFHTVHQREARRAYHHRDSNNQGRQKFSRRVHQLEARKTYHHRGSNIQSGQNFSHGTSARITQAVSLSGQQLGQAEIFTGYISNNHGGHIIIETVTIRAGRIFHGIH